MGIDFSGLTVYNFAEVIQVDIEKTGRFIAELRRERGLTQEQLGSIIGATNKTVSRWETGAYMPPIEVLELLSKEFGVTINEIISGERLSEKEFREKAEENLASAWQDSAFTLSERRKYFAARWEKRHLGLKIFLETACAALFALGELFFKPLSPAAVLIAIALAVFLNNKKAAYVERKAFGETPKTVDRDGNL